MGDDKDQTLTVTDVPVRIKGGHWSASEYAVGTVVKVTAEFDNIFSVGNEDDEGEKAGKYIAIGCNRIPVKMVKKAGGKINRKKGRVSCPMIVSNNGRLRIKDGREYQHEGWDEYAISEYATHVTIIEEVEPPEKIERALFAGMYACYGEGHANHLFFLRPDRTWAEVTSQGYVLNDYGPEIDCVLNHSAYLEQFTTTDWSGISRSVMQPLVISLPKSVASQMYDHWRQMDTDHPYRKAREEEQAARAAEQAARSGANPFTFNHISWTLSSS